MTESEIAPLVTGQSLKMYLPGKERGKREMVSGIQGAVDGGRWQGNAVLSGSLVSGQGGR